ncbi:MAG TPA: FtsW/RodA/SpoVE family cell cycle protein [Phycisphaerales bacterium]|nr:FtsW/RodA/SpoVE family cell cycle protein [Phycisphaerales bacterium]
MPDVSASFRSFSVSAIAHALARIGPAWLVIVASLALSLIGVYTIDIATQAKPHPEMLLGEIAYQQATYLCISILAAIIIILPNYKWVAYASWFFYALAIALLIFLLIPMVPWWIVRPRNGARSWINLGFMLMQPSEPAKIAYALALALYMRYRTEHRRFAGLLPPAIITAIPIGLITLQPDLGTASLFVPALFAVLIAAGARLRHLAIIVMLAAMAAPAVYPILKPHQQQRIMGLMKQLQGDTSADKDLNFQARTAQTLAAAGGWSGLSDDHSRSLVFFNALPEARNDMIFAVILNRFGVLGGLIVLGLYTLWFFGAMFCAAMTKDPFGRLVIVALAAFIAAQVFVNAGMNIGVLPIIGITLPFVSHGGSSLITVWAMVGLIASIMMRRPKVGPRNSFEFAGD